MKKVIFSLLSFVKKNWYVDRRLLKILYQSVIEPIMLYCGLVWIEVCKSSKLISKLQKCQRLIGILISGCYKTASTHMILGLAGITPVDILLRYNAVKRFHALKQLPFFYSSLPLCISLCRCIVDSIYFFGLSKHVQIEKIVLLTDYHPSQFKPINISLNFEEKQLKQNQSLSIRIFTDGSKIQDKVSAGFVIYGSDYYFSPLAEFSFRLPDHATVYQAELVAIRQALSFLKSNLNNFVENGRVLFHIDNQAAIRTSGNPKKDSSPIAFENHFLLEKMLGDRVSLNYVPAHCGHVGNERADFFSKTRCFLWIFCS